MLQYATVAWVSESPTLTVSAGFHAHMVCRHTLDKYILDSTCVASLTHNSGLMQENNVNSQSDAR